MANVNRWLGNRGVYTPNKNSMGISDGQLDTYLENKAENLRIELIEALGGYDDYIAWANQLSVDQHINRVRFCAAAEGKLTEIEQEAAEIIGAHFVGRQQDCITFTSAMLCALEETGDNGVEPVVHNISPFPCVNEDAIPY